MKFGVFVALVGMAAAVRLSDEPLADTPMPPSEGQEPTAAQKALMAEIQNKAKVIWHYKTTTDADNLRDAMKTNKEKAKEAKALKTVEAAAA